MFGKASSTYVRRTLTCALHIHMTYAGRVEAIVFNTLLDLLVTSGADGRIVVTYVANGKQVSGALVLSQGLVASETLHIVS